MSLTRSAGSPVVDGWSRAAALLVMHLAAPGRTDERLADLPDDLPAVDRARAQALFLASVRYLPRLREAIRPHVQRRPDRAMEARLILALAEMLDDDGEVDPARAARAVHHAVERTKGVGGASAAGFANAVLRRAVVSLTASSPSHLPAQGASVQALALTYGHPVWLVERWLHAFDEAVTRKLLAWNQRPAAVYGVWLDARTPRPEVKGVIEASQHPGCFQVQSGGWATVEAWLIEGRAVVMDPASRRPVALLAPQPGECILDLCAAPGSKSRLLATAIGPTGRLVAVDLPGPRVEKLEGSLAPMGGNCAVIGGDLRKLRPADLGLGGLPEEYSAVLVDAPCSNTGVLRRRPDAKQRLRVDDIAKAATLQRLLLAQAAHFVAPGGRLVFSTCSLEAEENTGVIEAFLSAGLGRQFRLETVDSYRPDSDGHDGGAAHLLRRRG